MKRPARIKIAEGFALPADGTLRRIRSKAGRRHVLGRADSASWAGDPSVRLDLLPSSQFRTESGAPLAEFHRVFMVHDTLPVPIQYLIDVIEPGSPDSGTVAAATRVEACNRAQIDHRPALVSSTPERAVYDPWKLRELLFARSIGALMEAADRAQEEGLPSEVVQAIANGWPEGKADVKEGDNLEVAPFGAMAFVYGRVIA